MRRIRLFLSLLICGLFFACTVLRTVKTFGDEGTPIFRIGIIGTTTSHVPAAINDFNQGKIDEEFQDCRITAAYVGGMPDNPNSWGRREMFRDACVKGGAVIYPTIEAMLPNVDGVLLMSVDGRCHLEQARPVIAAGKPLYLDKPAAGCLADLLEIYRLASDANVPVFSSSSLRFCSDFLRMRELPHYGAETTSPCKIDPRVPDLYFYGIHGIEILFTLMGKGCVSVSRTHNDLYDTVTGTWEDGKIGIFRGMRDGARYSGVIYGEKEEVIVGGRDVEYSSLFTEIARFFKTGIPPVSAEETINLYAFMTAADVSKAEDGKIISISSVMEEAEKEKSVLVQLRLERDGSLFWNDTPAELNMIPEKVKEAAADGIRVKVILDNRAGADFSVIEQILPLLNEAYLANYLYTE